MFTKSSKSDQMQQNFTNIIYFSNELFFKPVKENQYEGVNAQGATTRATKLSLVARVVA